MIQFTENQVTNSSQIEMLPYEVLEEVVKQIIPNNILPDNVPTCFEAVKAFSHTNKKIYLFIHSNRIHHHVVDVILKNMNETIWQQKDRKFSIGFLRWYMISNQLDQFINYFRNTQKIVNSVLNKRTFVYGKEIHKMRYYKKNLARHQVGNERQIKTGLIVSFSDFKKGCIDILYPLGKLTVLDVDISIVEALIKRLNTPFEGIFEKHRCPENGIVEDITQKSEENALFEFVECKDLFTPYYELSSRNRKGAFRISKSENLRYINHKKGKKNLIFCNNSSLFSCYQIDHVYPEIMHRNTGDREKELLSKIAKAYFRTTMGCDLKKQPFETYLEDIDADLYPLSSLVYPLSVWDSSSEASESD